MRSAASFVKIAVVLACVRGTNASRLFNSTPFYSVPSDGTRTYGIQAVVYSLVATYDSSNFFDDFTFWTTAANGPDPTSGDVEYVSRSVAESNGLVKYENGQVYLGVDYTTVNPSSGRQSVRLTSNDVFNQGLFIADIEHMPGGICGVWPAWWTFGSNPTWPGAGEIDIIENVNKMTTDQITLHSSAGCSVTSAGSLSTSTLLQSDCNYPGDGTSGCAISTTDTDGYGTGFNNVDGGVYAMQWASDGIYVWFFDRANIPADMLTDAPDTTTWGTPTASFRSNTCDFAAHFVNHNMVFDTTFCGDWAGNTWASDASCSGLATTCNDYVNANPAAFENAYWLINSVKVFSHV